MGSLKRTEIARVESTALGTGYKLEVVLSNNYRIFVVEIYDSQLAMDNAKFVANELNLPLYVCKQDKYRRVKV